MIRIKRIFVLLSIGISTNYFSFAQWKPQSPTIPSPNASSIGLYGEIPVSYFTGVPNISVPIYEVKGNKISLPISLSYNASGLRPEVHPGWVGNGWSLFAGGVITRKANGHIDEYYRPSTTGAVGYYYTASHYLTSSDWASASSANQAVLYPPLNYPLNTQATFDADEEPDEFSFNFLNYSGKFFVDQNGKWQVQCDKNLTVSFNPDDFITPFVYYQPTIGGIELSKTFGKFTIRDEAGNQYIFGCLNTSPDPANYNTAIEYSDAMIPTSGNPLTSSISATSWYLSKIISADGSETINLDYERGPLESNISFSYNANLSQGTNSGLFLLPSTSCMNGNPGSQIFSGNVIFPVYLTKITMPSQDLEIDFNKSASNELTYPLTEGNAYPMGGSADAYLKVYQDAGYTNSPLPYDFPSPYLMNMTSSSVIPYFSTNPAPGPLGYVNRFIWLKLDALVIKNTSSNFTEKTINFGYNNNSQKRLQLSYVSIADKVGAPIQNYTFNYNQTALPGYLLSNTDHWGFNNNNTNSISSVSTNNLDLLRSPDPTGVQTQAEILNSITYPTGGSTTFVYEPNTYNYAIYRNNGVMPVQEAGIAGGLRISQIISNDNNGKNLIKKYFYVNNYVPSANVATLPSSGVLNSKPIYNFTISGVDLNNNSYTYNSISSNSILPLTTTSTGTHIGYSNVIEQLSDGSYTQYQFTNHENGYNDIAPLSYNTRNPNALDYIQSSALDFERGKLFHKTVYNNNGNIVAENISTFSNNIAPYLNLPPLSANAVSSNLLQLCSDAAVAAVSRTAYSIFYNPFVPINNTQKTYDLTGTNNITSAVDYTYDQYKNIVQQNSTNSDGTVQHVYYKYAYNFATGDLNNPYNLMVAQNMNAQPIETIKTAIKNGGEYITGGEIHTYQQYGPGQIYNDAIYNFENSGQLTNTLFTPTSYAGTTSAGSLNMDSHYILRESLFYDNFGNLTSTKDDAGHEISYLWDIHNSKPVAKVINATNIYPGISPSNNIPVFQSFSSALVGQTFHPVIVTINVQRTGPITFSFVYNNNTAMSGNNSATFNYQLIGNGYISGYLCLALPGGTSSCSSTPTTATINNVAPGTYVLYLMITDMTGFQNYYGFTSTVTYPAYAYYTNTTKNDIAYTSFEYNDPLEISAVMGNWSDINYSNITSIGGALTGSNYYTLNGNSLTSLTLNPNQNYTVSYWSKNGSYTVSGSIGVVQGNILSSGWALYKHTVTGVFSVSISGNGAIDELRLYPADAQMTTYTYEPLVGIKNIVNEKQQINGFTYDNFQRLRNMTDLHGNIVKSYAYNYAPSSAQPIITGETVTAPNTINVTYIPPANCTMAIINYTDNTTAQTGANAGSCSGSLSVNVPNTGHTYSVTVTCYTAISSTTSAPVNVVVP